jgi:predicted ABC-type ATPase
MPPQSSIADHIQRRESVVQETTLSDSQALRNAEEAKRAGFRVEQYFVGLNAVEDSKQRVAQRVSQGGHHVPDDVIEKGFDKSYQNAVRLAEIADKSRFYDNSSITPHKIVLAREGREMSLAKDAPPWAREIHERLIRLDRAVSRKEFEQTRFKPPSRKPSGIDR